MSVGLGLGGVACIDPSGKYDDFVARKKAAQEDPDDEQPTGDAGPVELPAPEQIAGSYLYVVHLEGFDPTFYLLEVEAQNENDEFTLSMRYRPLSYADRMTPVGEFGEWETYDVEPSGAYETPELTIEVPGAANSLGVDAVVSKLVFQGNVANGKLENDEPGGDVVFFCGKVGPGAEVVALGIPQMPPGGDFTASRITDPNDYPDALLNCEGEEAEEL